MYREDDKAIQKEQDMIDKFEDILRHELSDTQFVRFVMNWFDPDMLCEMIVDSFSSMQKQYQKEYFKLIKTYLKNK